MTTIVVETLDFLTNARRSRLKKVETGQDGFETEGNWGSVCAALSLNGFSYEAALVTGRSRSMPPHWRGLLATLQVGRLYEPEARAAFFSVGFAGAVVLLAALPLLQPFF